MFIMVSSVSSVKHAICHSLVNDHCDVQLTHIRLASFLWNIGNGADPDQTPQNAASDQGLHCLLLEFSIKILCKNEKYHPTFLTTETDCSN